MNNFFYLLIGILLHTIGVNAQPIDVILIGGQSNATGQGYVANVPGQFQTDTNVLIYYSKYLKNGIQSEKWQALCPASEDAERFGVELSLGTTLQKEFPRNKIALIKHATSGSNLYNEWNPGNRPGEKQGEEYKKFLNTVKTGLDALKKQGYTPVIKAMAWQQGEADSDEQAGIENAQAYGYNLKNFILQVRKEFNCPEMLFIYGEVLPYTTNCLAGRKEVRNAQQQVSETSGSKLSVKKAILIEADDLQMRKHEYQTPYPEDDIHLGTFGILVLGERFAKEIIHQTKK